MSKVDEIKKIKELFDKGEISETEFETIKKDIMSKKDGEIINEEKSPKYSEISQFNVISAGKLIKRAVNAQVTSFILTEIGIVIFIFSIDSVIEGISQRRSIESILRDSPIFILASVLIIIGFFYWISSLMRMYKSGELLESSSFLVNNIAIEEKVIITHSAPEIISQTKKMESSSSKRKWEPIEIEFADGLKGCIFCNPTNNEYYFKDNKGFQRYYDTYDNCIDALHYNQTTGNQLDGGYKGTYF